MKKNIIFSMIAGLLVRSASSTNRILASHHGRVRKTGHPLAASIARRVWRNARNLRNLRNAERGGYVANWLAT